MKQVRIIIPKNMDAHFATWTFNNEIRVLLSYSIDDFFDTKIVVICAVPDDKLAAFSTEFKNYIK